MNWLADLRFGLRNLTRNPGFTAVAVAMMAVGIAVNAAVFSITNAVLFKGFPLVRENDRLLYLITGRNCCVSYPDFEDWRQAKSFAGMAIVHGMQKSVSDGVDFPETRVVTDVSAGAFRLVGIRPILGRDFTPADEAPGADPVAILRYSFWAARYQKNPAILGHTIRVNGQLTTIVGVMPPGFSFPQNQDLWMPFVPTAEYQKRENRNTWFVLGRVADGVSVAQARAEMDTIARRLASAYPLTNQGPNARINVRNFSEFFIGPNATMIYQAMLGAVAFVLLIACANVANLLLARSIGRAREVSVRFALGASRARILRQLLTESLMLSSLGGIAGWWLAGAAVHVYALFAKGASISDDIAGNWFDNVIDYSVDHRVLLYVVALSIATGILFGFAPARRLSNLDLNSALKDGGRGATGGSRIRFLSGLLVAAEVALAVVLLAGAGVMVRSFLKIYKADLGVRTDDVLTALLSLPKERYPGAKEQTAFFDRLQSRLETLPGVESVAIANGIPTGGSLKLPCEFAGAEPVDAQRRPRVSALIVSPEYFKTLGTAVVDGREFNAADGGSAPPSVIVNQRFAADYWPGQDPLGKRLRFDSGPWLTVVGIAPNIVENDFTRQRVDALAYVPYRQMLSASMWVILQTRVPPASLTSALRRELHAIDPDLPAGLGPYPMDQYLAWNYQYRGASGALFLIVAAIALVLASLGVYAVVAHSVSRRTEEIGIRLAVGATAADILKLVFRQGMAPLPLGILAGLAASLAVNHILRAQLIGVSPSDPATLLLAAAALAISAALGCWIPARRAMRVDPVVALRHE